MSQVFEGTVKGPPEHDERKTILRIKEVDQGFWIPPTIQPKIRGLNEGDNVRIKANPGRFYWFAVDIAISPKPPQETAAPRAFSSVSVFPTTAAPEAAAQLTLLPIEQLSGTLVGLERAGEDPEIDELAESAKAHGILQPVIAMLSPGTKSVYLVVAGNRRVKAAKMAGLSHVPAIIRPYSLEEAYEFSLIENIQRKDLSDYEKGRLLKLMLSKFPQRYPNQEALAKRLGKEQSWVSKHISAYETAEAIKGDLIPRGIKPEILTERQLRALHEAKPEERVGIIEQAASEGPISARKLESKIEEKGVKKPREGPGRKSKEELMREDLDKALKILHDQLGRIFQNVRSELQSFLKLYPGGHETICQYLADEFNSILALLPEKHAQLARTLLEKGKRA